MVLLGTTWRTNEKYIKKMLWTPISRKLYHPLPLSLPLSPTRKCLIYQGPSLDPSGCPLPIATTGKSFPHDILCVTINSNGPVCSFPRWIATSHTTQNAHWVDVTIIWLTTLVHKERQTISISWQLYSTRPW